MVKKIAFINQKGGVGKTTTSFNFAAYHTRLGEKVLGIDIDPQGNFTYNCGAEVPEDGKTIADLLLKKCTFDECVINTKYCDLLPANLDLTMSEMTIAAKQYKETLLSAALKNIIDQYDYIVVDCPPAFNVFVYNGLNFVDQICIVTRAQTFALMGIKQILTVLDGTNEASGRNVKIAGMIVTAYEPKAAAAKAILEVLENYGTKKGFKVIDSKISKSNMVENSQNAQESIFDFAPKSKPALEYLAAFAELDKYISEGE